MKKYIIFVISAFAFSNAFARIGETPEECKKRYGAPLNITETDHFYSKEGIIIVCRFFQDKCDWVQFQKSEKDILGKSIKMSDTEIELLLKANGSGLRWDKEPSIGKKVWTTEDGKMHAVYMIWDNILIFATNDWLNRDMEKSQAQDKEKLKDF